MIYAVEISRKGKEKSSMPKRYCGKGWEKHFLNTGGYVINVALKIDELKDLPKDKYGNVYIVVSALSEIDEKSNASHSVYVDDYRHPQTGEGSGNTAHSRR